MMDETKPVATAEELLARFRGGQRDFSQVRDHTGQVGLRLAGANLLGAWLQGANLSNANLRGACLAKSDISQCSLLNADLSETDLSGARLHNSDMSGATLVKANLAGADLRSANMYKAHLMGANLAGASFFAAHLFATNLQDAKAKGANLTYASFSRADLRGADFSRAILEGTVFSGVDLLSCTGLDAIEHAGPSGLSRDTLAVARGRLSQKFLRGCGLSDWEIAACRLYDPALRAEQRTELIYEIFDLQAGTPIAYQSVFISYSTSDEEFATRVYDDLQTNGVRCWFAPHDMQGGKKTYEQIDAAIQQQERLLLILSAASMSSNWVKTEIANARAKERRESRNVLFPIRLVPFPEVQSWKLFDADAGDCSAREIREYYVQDFSGWRHEATYEGAFSKLLRDLRP